MDDAERAYVAAEHEIARVRREGKDRLDLNRPATRALNRLPPEIAELEKVDWLDLRNTGVTDADMALVAKMEGLTTLWLSNTAISDAGAAALAGSAGLTWLSLMNTAIRDLRPFRDHPGLATGDLTLWFPGTAAARLDPEIARIAALDSGRSKALHAYLTSLDDDAYTAFLTRRAIEIGLDPAPEQTQEAGGAQFGVKSGRVDYGGLFEPTADQAGRAIEAILPRLDALTKTYSPQHNRCGTLGRWLHGYQMALTAQARDPFVIWLAGNQLRDLVRHGQYGDEPLTPEELGLLPAQLDTIVTLHNVLVSATPDTAALDRAALDSAAVVRAQANRELIREVVTVVQAQTTLIAERVRRDMEALLNKAIGDLPQALRNLVVEDESIQNLLRVLMNEAVLTAAEAEAGKSASRRMAEAAIGGMTGNTAFEAAKVAAPVAAASFPALAIQLSPLINHYLTLGWSTSPEQMRRAVEWLRIKLEYLAHGETEQGQDDDERRR